MGDFFYLRSVNWNPLPQEKGYVRSFAVIPRNSGSDWRWLEPLAVFWVTARTSQRKLKQVGTCRGLSGRFKFVAGFQCWLPLSQRCVEMFKSFLKRRPANRCGPNVRGEREWYAAEDGCNLRSVTQIFLLRCLLAARLCRLTKAGVLGESSRRSGGRISISGPVVGMQKWSSCRSRSNELVRWR